MSHRRSDPSRFAIRLRTRAGFTLLETLLILAIMGILVMLTITAVRDYAYYQSFVAFTTDVHDQIMAARTSAMAGANASTFGIYIGTSTIETFRGSTPTVGSSSNTITAIPKTMAATPAFSNGLRYLTFARVTGTTTATGTITLVDHRTVATTTFTINGAGLVQ